ncbi:YoaK family protein [Cetobacterium ceti]
MKKFFIFLLCFFSGFINILTLFKYAYSISHFSGNMSDVAQKMLMKNLPASVKIIFLLVFSFILGGFLIGMIIKDTGEEYKKSYGYVMIIYGVLISLINDIPQLNKFLLYFLTFTMGSQNALFIKYRGSVVRTTHMTGNLTELGTNLGKIVRGEKELVPKVLFSFFQVTFYFTGGVLGTFSYLNFNSNSFYIFGICYMVVGVFHLFFSTL